MNPSTEKVLQQLKDIKPPVPVPDHSLWLLLGVLGICFAVAMAIFFYWRRYRLPKYRRREDPIAQAKRKLRSIDYRRTKEAVYTFGEYLPRLIGEDEETMAEFERVESLLTPYKYKKEVPNLDAKTIEAMKRLVDKGLKHG